MRALIISMPAKSISEKGKDLSGEEFNESTDLGGCLLVFHNNIYDWGSRRHDEIELFDFNHEFVATVNVRDVSVISRDSLNF